MVSIRCFYYMFCSLWTKMSKRSFHSFAMFRYETMEEVISSTILSVMKLLFSIHILYICALNWILKQHLQVECIITLHDVPNIWHLPSLLKVRYVFHMFLPKLGKHWSLNTSCCKYNLHFWCQDQNGHEAILKMLGLAWLALWIFWIKTQLVNRMCHLSYFVSFLLPHL